MKVVTTVEVVLYTVPLSVKGFLSDTEFELTAVFVGKINVEPMLTYEQLKTIEKLAFLVA
jgi:hypothetical protein